MAFDLDDEELEATRRLNGVAKDKIEEDIYIRCKELTKKENARWIGISNQRAIKKLLERIKELEEENKNRINREIADYKRILKINNVKVTEEDWKNDKSWIIAMLNVAEEDATKYKKELEELKEQNKKYNIHLTDKQYRKAIENAQKDVEDKYKKKIAKLQEKLLDMIEGTETIKKETTKETVEYIKENYIPVQKVKDLKKSIILEPTIVGGRRNAKTLEYGIKLGKIKACEELLEEK